MADELPPPPTGPRRYSVSQLPADADPAEKEFVGLLHKALAPSYVLIRRLGAGGMGAVYVARDPVLKRLVAVKVMSPELARDPDARTRFEREAQAVAAISHVNVVSIYAVGELENGLPYIVMQYVEGRSMSERIEEDGPLDVPAAKKILGEVASALAATHKKGIIHRDIKPANILFDDETGRALVTDFGIAAVRERPDDRPAIKITQTGMSVGTPAYMSPEQFLAEPITDKTDIYALGLLGYELLVGEGPYAVKSPADLMAAHLRDAPRKISTLKAEVDAELETLLSACLSKNPTERPSAQFVADQLTKGTSALLEWPPPGLESATTWFMAAQRQLLAGGFTLGVPLLALSTVGLDTILRQALPSGGALFLVALLGFSLMCAGFLNLGGLLRVGDRGVRNGYRWLTVFEVALDSRGDGGALIAGGREYAALSPAERSTLRTRRLVSGALRIVAALLPVSGFVVNLFIAARLGAGTYWLVMTSLVLAVVLLLVASLEDWLEVWQLRKARARLARARTARAQDATLGKAWTETLLAVAQGQRLGRASAAALRPGFRNVLVTVATLFVLGTTMLAYAVAAVGAGSEMVFDSFGNSNIGNSVDRVRQVSRLEKLRLPIDSSITPLQAGKLLADMPRQLSTAVPNATEERYLRTARAMTPAALDSVRRFAADTQLPSFRRFARAGAYDFMGAAASLEKLDSLNLAQLPVPKVGRLRELASANVMSGVLALHDGRTAEAELRFREVASAGFLMIREGNTHLETLIGRMLVLRARVALLALYQQTGRSVEASFVSTASDPAEVVTPDRQLQLDQRQARIAAMRFFRDSTMPRGIRKELLYYPLAYGACGDLHQILFGVDPEYTKALKQARSQLVRTPSDSVVWLKFELALERPMIKGFGEGAGITLYRALLPIARSMDFLTGSRRMESCLSMLS